MMWALGVVVGVVADDQQDTMSKLIDDAGPIALLFVVLLAVGVYLLWRSMTKQLKRIDPQLPDGRSDRLRAADAEATDSAVRTGEQTAAGSEAAEDAEPDESPRP